jgi:hypothetical protein
MDIRMDQQKKTYNLSENELLVSISPSGEIFPFPKRKITIENMSGCRNSLKSNES